MATQITGSYFSWMDYSERERREALDVIDLFSEQDTRDELGIGTVRDAFADLLFPGTPPEPTPSPLLFAQLSSVALLAPSLGGTLPLVGSERKPTSISRESLIQIPKVADGEQWSNGASSKMLTLSAFVAHLSPYWATRPGTKTGRTG